MSSITTSNKLRALAAAFNPNEISWRATRISPSGTACEFTPVVSLAAYERRLGEVLGAWNYTFRCLPAKEVGVGDNIVAECLLTLPGIGSYRGVAKLAGDGRQANTHAEAEAYRNACIAAGVGSGLRPLWVGISVEGEPRFLPETPNLVSEALLPQNQPLRKDASGMAVIRRPKVRTLPSVDRTMRSLRQEIGEALYREALGGATRSSAGTSTSDIAQARLLRRLQAIGRGVREAKYLAQRIPDYEFHSLLEDHGVVSLLEIPCLQRLIDIVRDMRVAASKASISQRA